MDLLYDPHEISRQYARYIDDLRRLFVFHGLSCGTPRHLGALASKLELSKALRADLSALLGSTRDLHPELTAAEALALVTVAIGGDTLVLDPISSPLTSHAIAQLQFLVAGVGGWHVFAQPAERWPGQPHSGPIPSPTPQPIPAPGVSQTNPFLPAVDSGVDVRAFVRAAESPAPPGRFRREPLSEIVRPSPASPPAPSLAPHMPRPSQPASAEIASQPPAPAPSSAAQTASAIAAPAHPEPAPPQHQPDTERDRLEQAILGLTLHLESMERRIAELEPRLSAALPPLPSAPSDMSSFPPGSQPAPTPAPVASAAFPAAVSRRNPPQLPSLSADQAASPARDVPETPNQPSSPAGSPHHLSQVPDGEGSRSPGAPTPAVPHLPETVPAEPSGTRLAAARTPTLTAALPSPAREMPRRVPRAAVAAAVLLLLALVTVLALRRKVNPQISRQADPAPHAVPQPMPLASLPPAPSPAALSPSAETVPAPPASLTAPQAPAPAGRVAGKRSLLPARQPRIEVLAVRAPSPDSAHATSPPPAALEPDAAAPKSRNSPILVPEATMERQLLATRRPAYPAAARDEHLEATVILSAVVDTAGSVRRVDVVAGPPAFINSAIAAATWRRYRPFLLHGRPVEVQTRITLRYAPANP